MKKRDILVLGGYGGNNVGDDAQLEGSLNALKETIPEASVIVLTPNLDQTMSRHWPNSVAYAPRISFFDFDKDPHRYIKWWVKGNKEWLLNQLKFIISEAIKYKSGLSYSLSDKQVQAIELIKNASIIYYAGGGFLMGPTGSRLWDGALVCQLAKIFDTPVVMSGQNLGIWQNQFNLDLAAYSFDKVKLIGTRDRTFSKEELSKAGIQGDHIFDTHDDALYIKTDEVKIRDYILRRVGLKQDEPYISLSFHLEDGIENVIRSIRKHSKLPILIIPTCPPDKGPQGRVYKKLKDAGFGGLHIVSHLHSHNKIKSLIGNADICISTRHHPVIFALGCSVPAISLNYTEYFSQKNFGALELCNIGHLSFDMKDTKDVDFISLESLISEALENRDSLSETIKKSHTSIIDNKNRFLEILRDIWDESVVNDR